jgi:sRNA-binding regulator protein Hfq
MRDSSAIPVRRVESSRQTPAKTSNDAVNLPDLPSISPAGPRKLIRPHLPENGNRYPSRYGARSAINRARPEPSATRGESSHAEAYYLQKQVQSRTPMIFLLENGERVEGTIEWYDRHAIKVRKGALRTLIYKDGIKYLYKAVDANQINTRP